MSTIEEIDAEIAKRQKAQDLNSAVDAEIQKRLQTQDPQTSMQQLEAAFQKIPLAPTLSEFASGVNRSVFGAIDFLGTDTLNAIGGLMGIDAKIPSLEENIASEGGFMEPGLARDAVAAAGEVVPLALAGGAGVRSLAQKALTTAPALPSSAVLSQAQGPISATAAGAESVGAGLVRQVAQTGPAADLGFGAASGAGQVIGEDAAGPAGGLLGSFAGPMFAQAGVSTLKGVIGLGGKGIQMLSKSIENLSDEGAGQLLAQMMVREGISPEDFGKRLVELGPEAIPADVGNNFARLLKVAANEVPRIQGRAADLLFKRQEGQSKRIIDALDDASGTSSLSAKDEIERLNTTLGPKINDLYNQVRGSTISGGPSPASGINVQRTQIDPPSTSKLPPTLRRLFEGNNAVSRAAGKAQGALDDRIALRDKVGDIDLVDETKKVMDDQIGKALRLGEKNLAMRLVRLKNEMVGEADKAIPVYKEARDLFAGKAQMENAAEAGTLYVKMNARELSELAKGYSISEKKMFKLGAKQAIMDKIDLLQMNSDLVKKMFRKNGDVTKLRSLFDSKKEFDQFAKALEREGQFVLTKNAAMGGSSTVQQAMDVGSASEIVGATMSLLGSPVQSATAFGRILSGLAGKKGSAVFTESLEKAGDILLTKGMNPARIQGMLRRGNPNEVEAALRKIMIKPADANVGAIAGALEFTGDQ